MFAAESNSFVVLDLATRYETETTTTTTSTPPTHHRSQFARESFLFSTRVTMKNSRSNRKTFGYIEWVKSSQSQTIQQDVLSRSHDVTAALCAVERQHFVYFCR
jgi:hypothetical protein